MAKVQVTNVAVLDNPTDFFNPFQFEITFECVEDLPDGRSLFTCGGILLIEAHQHAAATYVHTDCL